MVGSFIGGALGAIGSVMGSIGKNQKLSEQQAQINKRMQENEGWFNRRYYEDATQRVDAQSVLSNLEESLAKRIKAAEGRKAVMGGTAESIAAEKEANSGAMADAVAQIAAAGEARKDAVEQQYLNRKDQYNDQLMGVKSQKLTPGDFMSGAMGGFANGIGIG